MKTKVESENIKKRQSWIKEINKTEKISDAKQISIWRKISLLVERIIRFKYIFQSTERIKTSSLWIRAYYYYFIAYAWIKCRQWKKTKNGKEIENKNQMVYSKEKQNRKARKKNSHDKITHFTFNDYAVFFWLNFSQKLNINIR